MVCHPVFSRYLSFRRLFFHKETTQKLVRWLVCKISTFFQQFCGVYWPNIVACTGKNSLKDGLKCQNSAFSAQQWHPEITFFNAVVNYLDLLKPRQRLEFNFVLVSPMSSVASRGGREPLPATMSIIIIKYRFFGIPQNSNADNFFYTEAAMLNIRFVCCGLWSLHNT